MAHVEQRLHRARRDPRARGRGLRARRRRRDRRHRVRAGPGIAAVAASVRSPADLDRHDGARRTRSSSARSSASFARPDTRWRSRRATTPRRSRCSSGWGSTTSPWGATAAPRVPTSSQALASRTWKMRRFARGRFDLAVAHGSNDLALAAASLRIPAVNTFDYEFAIQQHNIGCRLARRVMTPDAIPPERLERFGVGAGQARPVRRGSRRSTTCRTSSPTRGALEELGVDREKIARDRPPAARRVALSPQVQPAVPARARAPRAARGRHGGRDPAHRGPARARVGARAAVGDRARARGRRPEPDRARRPRGVGRRDDEPRGGRARHARSTRPTAGASAASTSS